VLEDLVALLHKVGSADVRTRVRLPVPDHPDAPPREIDVLVSHDVAGNPLQIALECKNERKPLGIEYVDAFLGKLLDVGIPASQGILVSPSGYTRDARLRAARAQITLLQFEGLNEARLAAAINAALLHLVHLVLFVESMSMFPFLPPGAPGQRWPDGVAFNEIEIQNHLWRQWITGLALPPVGDSDLFLVAGDGGAVVECRVRAFVGQIPGTGSFVQLRNIASGSVERGRLLADFNVPNTVALAVFDTVESLAALEDSLRSDGHVVVQRVRVPRIVDVTGRMF
jgi:hypothetical protein